MAPISRSDLARVKRVAKLCEIRNIGEAYPKTIIIDRTHLMQLRYPATDGSDIAHRFRDIFYTNDPTYLDGMHRLLSNLWVGTTTLEDLDLTTHIYGWIERS